MKILVTGATGYVGSAVCGALKAAGHTVTGLTRSETKAGELRARGYLALVGDLSDSGQLSRAAREADGVIHTAMEFNASAGEVDAKAVRAILEGLERSGKPFIYTSGVWVHGDTKGRMVGEVSHLDPPPLVAWRPAVEDLVVQSKELGVKGMVFRPGRVFGRKTGFLKEMFAAAAEHGVVRVIGNGEYHWSCVHVDDLADLYARAIAEPAAGEVFITCGGMPQPAKKIALAVAKAAGIEGRLEFVPLPVAREQMGPIADCIAMDCKTGSTKAARFFGWTVRHPSIFDEIFSGSYLN
jgi:nucleoside-diphosphate-sugar epimerase